jgi:hypothetical protein
MRADNKEKIFPEYMICMSLFRLDKTASDRVLADSFLYLFEYL